jgi:hypothetical protein
MTYNGEMGNDPYPEAKAYLFNNMNVRHKTCTPLISHNLIIETLINEPLGSLSAYSLIDGEVVLEREEFESDTHQTKIRTIHNGVLNFSDLWIQKIEKLNAPIKLESNSATYLLTMFFSRPENIDLEILRGLVFDNAFAGANNTYILSPRGANDKDIWKEGLALVKKNTKPVGAVSAAATNVKNITTAIVKATAPIVKAATASPKPAPAAPKVATPEKSAIPKVNISSDIKLPVAQTNVVELPTYTGEKSYRSVKSLHRTQFLHALSSIAFPGKNVSIDNSLISLVTSKGKDHVAIKFLKANGGIWSSKLSLKEKVYLSASNLSDK